MSSSPHPPHTSLDSLVYNVVPPAYHALAPGTERREAEISPPVDVSATARLIGAEGSSGFLAVVSNEEISARSGRRDGGGNGDSDWVSDVMLIRRWRRAPGSRLDNESYVSLFISDEMRGTYINILLFIMAALFELIKSIGCILLL